MKRLTLSLALVVAMSSCSEARPRDNTPTVVLPGPTGSPPPTAAAPEDDDKTSHVIALASHDLNDRERKTWWSFMATVYTPCASEAVSVAQCVKEERQCAACVPAAKLLAAKVKEGATKDQLEKLYAERFGPNVKEVDLTGSPSRGPEHAAVTIVEWFDFECPHCRMALPMLDKLQKKHEGEIRLVKKFYPLTHHTHAEPAARAAIAAMNQGKFWQMEHTIFEHQNDLEDADLEKYAAELKLDANRFAADMRSGKTTELLKRDHDEAERDGLNGTPFILINGREFDLSLFHLDSDLESWVETEITLAAARK